MEQKAEQKKCAYCGNLIPQQSAKADTPWLMEKASYGVNAFRWHPQSQVIWDLDKFYQFCSFSCVEPMIQDFVTKERWRIGSQKVQKAEVTS